MSSAAGAIQFTKNIKGYSLDSKLISFDIHTENSVEGVCHSFQKLKFYIYKVMFLGFSCFKFHSSFILKAGTS